MNIVYSFLVPLVCWASHGFSEGLSPIKTARRIRKSWFQLRRPRERTVEAESRSSHGACPLRLKWHERHSFFDPAVQKILRERHPDRVASNKDSFKGFPIDAWKVVDQFARTAGASERSLAEFGVFMRLDPVWISQLLSAVTEACANQGQARFRSSTMVAAENRRRARLMNDWAESWIAHYRLHAHAPGGCQGDDGDVVPQS